jgi:hypothetical protein
MSGSGVDYKSMTHSWARRLRVDFHRRRNGRLAPVADATGCKPTPTALRAGRSGIRAACAIGRLSRDLRI